ncbi:hypothetical protein [Streptomyces sp. NPDC090036]|uniref:hypothetical protein n=1 Tax=Streptomyces sp. NPDC090036 TaxID=3365926 RepID=UPI00382BE24E
MLRTMSSAVSLALAGALAVTGVAVGTATAAAAPAVSAEGAGETPVGAQAWTRVSKTYPNRSSLDPGDLNGDGLGGIRPGSGTVLTVSCPVADPDRRAPRTPPGSSTPGAGARRSA